MILALTPANPFAFVNTGSPSRGGRAEAFLRTPKLQALQSKTESAFKTTDRLVVEQAVLLQSPLRVKQLRDKLDDVRVQERDQLENIENCRKSIVSDLQQVTSSFQAINAIGTDLSQVAGKVQQEQDVIALKIKGIEKRNQIMQQQIITIENNHAEIKQNLSTAGQKIEHMQKDAEIIKADLASSALIAAEIEEKKQDLEEKIPDLLNLEQKTRKVDVLTTKEVSTPEVVGFWSRIVQKIIDYSSWFFSLVIASIVGGKVNIKKWLAAHHVHSASDAIQHPAAWTIIGLTACSIIQNAVFSMACLGVGCSLIYYRWKKNPQMIHQEGAHAA